MNLDDLRRAFRPITNRLANLVGRGVVKGVDDAKKVQELQVRLIDDTEVRDEIERFQEYGFTSNPPTDSEVVVVFVNGRRDHGLALGAEDRRYRIKNLASGEVAIYSQHGQSITLKANGDIEVTPKAGQKTKFATDVEVTGTLTASVDVVGGGKHLATHTHGAGAGTLITSCGAGAGSVTTGTTGGPS